MSGHNKWSQIKHQKGATDKKRSVFFSKILKAITIAARDEQTPTPNSLGVGVSPRLRALIEKAKKLAVPNENIERAIRKTQDGDALEELTLEAYGPNGIAILIGVITDSRNRTINEVRHLLIVNGGKLGEEGSVRWAFNGTIPKFPQAASDKDCITVQKITDLLEDREDVQSVVTNILAPNA